MQGFLQALYSGILLGSIYALMAMGLSLIWGALRMLNLAHGALFMVGGYVAWVAAAYLGLHPLFGIVLAFLAVGVLGSAVYAATIKPLLGRPGWDTNTLISTTGVGIVLENLALYIFGPRNKSLPPMVEGALRLSQVTITYHALVIILVAVSVMVGMAVFLSRSRHGLAIRAIAQNMDGAHLLGIPVQQTFGTVMAISAGLSAIAGVLLTAFYFLSPTVGFTPMLKALIVTIFGGLGSIHGTMWAAFVIGLLEAMVSLLLGVKWALLVLFMFMVVVLIVRPNGLFGLGEERRL